MPAGDCHALIQGLGIGACDQRAEILAMYGFRATQAIEERRSLRQVCRESQRQFSGLQDGTPVRVQVLDQARPMIQRSSWQRFRGRRR